MLTDDQAICMFVVKTTTKKLNVAKYNDNDTDNNWSFFNTYVSVVFVLWYDVNKYVAAITKKSNKQSGHFSWTEF